ncbi:hypothetical protein HanXRQr2_Chr03g0120371 [Helianthus annuus]|uniref:Uncharacterized protein n=1 Tax=Helianthus annuus TaxID=4232 RepID=A0A9K3NVV1_HELAN|nr:hypothetical protein HanXRQr2_Chr03g0120371 [Helianthus annuus]KAJ0944451.1 hypothetical protein HanPSC8_Chr03g0116911 [Helianthus annuus]
MIDKNSGRCDFHLPYSPSISYFDQPDTPYIYQTASFSETTHTPTSFTAYHRNRKPPSPEDLKLSPESPAATGDHRRAG